MKKWLLILALIMGATLCVSAAPNWSLKGWDGQWIGVPGIDGQQYGVYEFKKEITVATPPSAFGVKVSADNRYKLYVNGHMVALGPARSDISHWNYDTVDLVRYLHAGSNEVKAVVWNDGTFRPEANMSLKTGFVMTAATDNAAPLNTDTTWLCRRNMAYEPLDAELWKLDYYVAGPGEVVDMRRYAAAEGEWLQAAVLAPALPRESIGAFGMFDAWMLQPSPLPQCELSMQRLASVRRSVGAKPTVAWLSGKAPLTIAPHTEAEILIDNGVETNAYFTLKWRGGKDCRMSIGYAESLYTQYPDKGNRNEVGRKTFIGRRDSIVSNGGNGEFTTLAWRTYRYVMLRVQTADEPLVIDDLYGTFTGFPFALKASLQTTDKEMQKIFDVGWRTARLCATETYMDCPYYEQLQYFGDARIQALISMYLTGDDRLVKNLLRQADYSRSPEGITTSRYPENTKQQITTYGLSFIGTLKEYMMMGSDMAFVRDRLMAMRSVLSYFQHYQQADGSVSRLPGWCFTDWVYFRGWHNGIADVGSDGTSALVDLQLLEAYQNAAAVESAVGEKAFAAAYSERANQLKQTIRRKYWDAKNQLFADRIELDNHSQHAQALAILTGVATASEAQRLAQRLENDTTLAPASIYFKYYTHRAMASAGLGDHYMAWLDNWRENLRQGLTTWAETSKTMTTRSDCHAWGASPNIEFFRTVLGIDSDAPAFRHVRIAPNLGNYKEIGGNMPHPEGMISVAYKHKGGSLQATVTLPSTISGTLVWQNQERPLKPGTNTITINDRDK